MPTLKWRWIYICKDVDECLSTNHAVWRFWILIKENWPTICQTIWDINPVFGRKLYLSAAANQRLYHEMSVPARSICSLQTSNPVWEDRLRRMCPAYQVWIKRKCSHASLYIFFWSVTWFLQGVLQSAHSICQYWLFTLAKGRLLKAKVNQGKLIYQFKLKHGDDGLALL